MDLALSRGVNRQGQRNRTITDLVILKNRLLFVSDIPNFFKCGNIFRSINTTNCITDLIRHFGSSVSKQQFRAHSLQTLIT